MGLTKGEVVGNPASPVHKVLDSLHEIEDLILCALSSTAEVLFYDWGKRIQSRNKTK